MHGLPVRLNPNIRKNEKMRKKFDFAPAETGAGWPR